MDCLDLPLLFGRSDRQFPLHILPRVDRDLIGDICNGQEGQQPHRVGKNSLSHIDVIEVSQDSWMAAFESIELGIVDPNYCIVFSAVFVNESCEFCLGCRRGVFQLDIHELAREGLEQLLERWNPLSSSGSPLV